MKKRTARYLSELRWIVRGKWKILHIRWFLVLMFATSTILPWLTWYPAAGMERAEHLELARQNLRMVATAYAEHVAAHLNSGLAETDPSSRYPASLAQPYLATVRLYVRDDSHLAGAAAGRTGEIVEQTPVPHTSLMAVASVSEASILGGLDARNHVALITLFWRDVLALGIGTFLFQQLKWREAAEQELIRSRRAADDGARAKAQFMAKMSHELRTPLNAIIGFSEVIKTELAGPLSGRYREYGELIFASGAQLLRLVENVLDLSRLESGRLELHEAPVDLQAILDLTLRQAEKLATRSGLEISADIPPDLPILLGDSARLQQVFDNILANSVKYTREHGRIEITARSTAKGVFVRVTDTGIGIPAHQIPLALAPFHQVNAPPGSANPGLGLGLPLARYLVELHGGTLTIESQPGVGTAVWIEFPASRTLPQPKVRAATSMAALAA